MIDQETQAFDVFSTLLTQGHIVKPPDLEEARAIAKDLSIPLPKALVMSGVTSEVKINLALQAKSMFEQKTISLDLAIRGLRLAVHTGTDLDNALGQLARVHKATQQVVSLTNDLTALLLAAKLITGEQLGEAVKRSQDTKMLIGHTLLLMGTISPSVLAAALNAVLLIRQKLLEKDNAAQGLRYANQRQITIEQALFELAFFTPPKPETMRLSELAHMADLLSQSALVECIELELFKQKPFGQVLLEQGLISQPHLDAAIELQGSVANEALKPNQAAAALRRVCKDNVNLYQAMAEAQADMAAHELRIGELLVSADVCTQEAIDRCLLESQASAIKIGKALLAAGQVTESMLYSALRCQSLCRQGYFSMHQAIASLAYCKNTDVGFDEALVDLSYNVPSRMQWLWV